jgi:hypothetical protein
MKLTAETIPAKARRRVAEPTPSGFDATIRAALPVWSAGVPFRLWVVGCVSPAQVRRFLEIVAECPPAEWNSKSRVFITDANRSVLDAARQAVAGQGSTAFHDGSTGVHDGSTGGPWGDPARPDFAADANSARPLPHFLQTSLVFAEHDLLRAPPFARLDVIFYARPLGDFTAAETDSIFGLFHYALSDGGRLLLHPETSPLPETGWFEPVTSRGNAGFARSMGDVRAGAAGARRDAAGGCDARAGRRRPV